MVEVANRARERLAKGESSLGMGIRLSRSVDIAQAMQTAGYDWLFLDLEHSAMDLGMSMAGATQRAKFLRGRI